MQIDSAGLLQGALYIPSPNCDERPAGTAIELLVIHNISLPPGEFGGPGIVDLFTNKLDGAAHPYYREIAPLRVSAHFLVRRGGELIQFVPVGKRAWHAGESSWRGRDRCNDYSIGIELEGTDDMPFADIQYERLAHLTNALQAAYALADSVGHSDIAPARKPGKLPWHTERESYELEYRSDVLEMHTDAVGAGARVLVVDDVLATGGTAAATCRLVERLGGTVVGVSVLVELGFLQGRTRLPDRAVHAVVTF